MAYEYLLGLWGEKGKKGGGLAIDVSSGPVFLSKKRRIGTDVSSGLIFLTEKNKMWICKLSVLVAAGVPLLPGPLSHSMLKCVLV